MAICYNFRQNAYKLVYTNKLCTHCEHTRSKGPQGCLCIQKKLWRYGGLSPCLLLAPYFLFAVKSNHCIFFNARFCLATSYLLLPRGCRWQTLHLDFFVKVQGSTPCTLFNLSMKFACAPPQIFASKGDPYVFFMDVGF